MAGYEEFTGEYVGRVLVNASIILSPDPRAERHNVTMGRVSSHSGMALPRIRATDPAQRTSPD